MEAVTIICWIVAGFSIAHNIWAFLNIAFACRWIASKRKAVLPKTASTEVVIFLPMFAEQSIALDAIEHFLKMDYPRERYRIVIVTTRREDHNHKHATTADRVAGFLGELDGEQVLHFNADGDDHCKADQLNQAIAHFDREEPEWWNDDTIIGVYDADSRPELHSLRDLDRAVAEHPAFHAFQQPAVYLLNINRLPGGFHGHYLRSRPLYNLRFCLYREMPGFLRSLKTCMASKLWKTFASSPNHFLGHGEFVRRSALSAIGGFPPPSGDTSLGTVLSFVGQGIVPLSSFDLGETPKDAWMLIRQASNWYAGCNLYVRDAQMARKLGTQDDLRCAVMLFKRWLENMIWTLGPLLLLAAICWSISTVNVRLAFACLGGATLHLLTILQVFNCAERLKANNRFVSELPLPGGTKRLATLAFYPLMLIGNCFGPLLYYGLLIKSRVCGSKLPRPKTTRSADIEEPESTAHR